MFARHNRVWLSAQGWQHALPHVPPAYREEIDAWRQANWPLVTRRADAGTGRDQVCVGLAMPPRPACGTKPKVALRVSQAHVARVLPPLKLEAITAAIPAAWHGPFQALLQDASEQQLAFKVFGSGALQAMTGKPYITPASDLDLLFYPASRAQLQRALSVLEKHAAHLPLDGEIVFPTGEAVSWKEWSMARHAASNPRVLVKGMQSVHLATPASLLAILKDA